MNLVDELYTQAVRLNSQDRLQLIQKLILTLEPEGENLTDDEWKAAWLPELQARVEAYERGDRESSDWRDVIARLRESLAARESQ